MEIRFIGRNDLVTARQLLVRALPFDRVDVVAEEKLFGDNGARTGIALGAFEGDRLVGVMAAAGRWIKLIAVEESQRRRGVGTALLHELKAAKRRLCDHPGNYLTPGLDVRCAEAHAFFEKRGFRVKGRVENIRCDVTQDFEQRGVDGYEIARADSDEVVSWVAKQFAPVWGFEVARAMAGPRRAVHVAKKDGQYVAFAAADGNNQGLGWFGPAGTDPAHRGKKLGEALLLRCLVDVRGLPEAGVIAWIGPRKFYERACGAGDDRTFLTMEEDR